MKFKQMPFILLFCLLGITVYSQSETDVQNLKLSLKAGYFGEFVMHPGLYAGVDYPLITKDHFDLHWDTEMGFYVHKWNNNALFMQTSLGTRLTTSFSFCFDVNLGLGFMISTPNGDVYSYDDGIVAESPKPVTWHFRPSLNFLFGWNPTKTKEIPFMVQLGPEFYMQSSYNHVFLPHLGLKLGLVYKL